jgi:prophage tail gpP-like protein
LCETGTETKIVLSEENLANFITQNTQQKREKRNEKRVSKSKQAQKKKNKTQSISLKGKGTKLCSKACIRSI